MRRPSSSGYEPRTPGYEMGKGAHFTEEDTVAWEGSALPKAKRTPATKLECGIPTPGPMHSQSFQITRPELSTRRLSY